MSPVSMTYGAISGYVIFWVFFALAVGLFLRRIYQLGRYLFLGRGRGIWSHGEETAQHCRRGIRTMVPVQKPNYQG